jgi:hypothetical protein
MVARPLTEPARRPPRNANCPDDAVSPDARAGGSKTTTQLYPSRDRILSPGDPSPAGRPFSGRPCRGPRHWLARLAIAPEGLHPPRAPHARRKPEALRHRTIVAACQRSGAAGPTPTVDQVFAAPPTRSPPRHLVDELRLVARWLDQVAARWRWCDQRTLASPAVGGVALQVCYDPGRQRRLVPGEARGWPMLRPWRIPGRPGTPLGRLTAET